ncbi:HlyD family secretion protein [Devosia sp.]|uniref:HlyD family secretion protein n=1 Tax=Devosia sp. TaxID=1871048 RepID=UPI003A93DFD3
MTPADDNDTVAAGAAVSPRQTSPTPPPAAPKAKSRGRRIALMLSVPLLLVAAGGWFVLTGGRYVETDNAYIQQPKVSISSDVSGRIATVSVVDNQPVKAGDVLFTIDPEPYRIALDQADAALAAARVNVEQLRVGLASARARLQSAQATLEVRQKDWERQSGLKSQGVATEAKLDDARLALRAAEANVALEEQDVANSIAALAGDADIATDDHPAVRSALAARDSAVRNLEKTTVRAPGDGIVSQVASLNVGQFVSTGTTIASLVETGDVWIVANFKETQLDGIVVGQPVEVKVDAYPGLVLEGDVQSIGAGTGSEFSLIPAQNATGNWVKVTQRIPVRIAVTDPSETRLRAGMSTVVTVDTQPETGSPGTVAAAE